MSRLNPGPTPRRALLRSLAFLVVAVALQDAAHAQRFELVWQDEFDGPSLNTDTWIASFSTAYNNELQFYTNRSQNLQIRDGVLNIIGLRERYQTRDWTSARIRTQGRMDFRYGKVEMRARLPEGKGLWPAFWMLPSDNTYGPWPYSGEIDILENRGHQMDRFQTTVHYSARAHPGSGNALADRRYIEKETVLSADSLNAWHTYGLSWEEDRLTWFFDGQEVFTIPRTQIEASAGIYPFDQDFHLILNLAIGGNYLGDAQPDASTPDTSRFEIDYVRLYQDVNVPPVVESLPTGDVAVESGASVRLEPQIRDTDGTVDSVWFSLNGVTLAAFDTAPYVFDWTAGVDGCYTFRVEASDNDGGRTLVDADGRYVVGRGCSREPFDGEPIPLPGRIELEHFDHGGHALAYFDATPFQNSGGVFRPFDAVDLSAHPVDSLNVLVDELQEGEWMEYTVEVAQSGTYAVVLGSVKDDARGRVDLSMDGEQIATFSRLSGDCGDLLGAGAAAPGARCTTRNEIALQVGVQKLRVNVVSDPGRLDFLHVAMTSATSVEGQGGGGQGSGGQGGGESPLAPQTEAVALSVFPNPFNPTTTIRFTLQTPQRGSLSVHTMAGQQVIDQPVRWFMPGVHTVEFNASGYPSGVYIVRLATDSGVWSERMILVK